MTTNGRPSTAGYVFGGLSFIPAVGVIFAIVAIVIGAVKRDNKVAFLGVGGIAFSVVLYTALFYFGFVATVGPYAALKIKLAERLMRDDAGRIALYKLRHGHLPATLAEIPEGRDNAFLAFDPWLKPLAYRVNPDGSFELRSAGPDGKFNTADDIVQTY
ncbi:MAG TPA: hypothetical protein VGG01_17290 [Xanthobacteraceae bacterium]|jgi:hypothetical protein